MESNSPDPFTKLRWTASPLPAKKPSGFSGPEPASLGFDMPDWLAPSVPPPTDAALPLAADPNPLPLMPEHEPEPLVSTPPEPRTLLEGMKVVCICKGIKKRIFWKALDDGAQTKDDVNRLTGSGSGGCQGRRCGPRILDMLRHHLR